MLGLGRSTFISDWAGAVRTFAEVVGVTSVPELPPDARPISDRAAVSQVAGIEVVFVRPPRLRPTRWLWRLNAQLEAIHLKTAAQYLQRIHGRIDVVHSHFYAAAAAAPLLARHLGVPLVHTEHSSRLAGEVATDKRISRAGRAILRSVLEQSHTVMLVGEDQLRTIRQLGMSGRVEVVGNPVDSDAFRVGVSRRGRERLVTVGSLIGRKRHDLLLGALARLHVERPDLQLDLIGAGPEEERLRRLAWSLGLGSVVHFLGRLSRTAVAETLANSDLYVHAAETESFGVSIVEGLFTGLPVVALQCGGVTELVVDEVAMIVEDATPESLAGAIALALEPDRFAEAETIREWAIGVFGINAVAPRIEAVFRRALA